MGHIYMTIKIKGKAKRAIMLKHKLIDTGAWYTFVKPSVIAAIRPVYLGKDKIELGDKKVVLADVYVAKISYADRNFKYAHIATFEGAAEAIGAQTLEGLGVWLDPREQKIIITRKKNVMFYH